VLRFSAGIRDISAIRSFERDCGTHPTFFSTHTKALFSELKRSVFEAETSSPYSGDVKNGLSYLTLQTADLQMNFMSVY
jgi:hypothetical protein